jgi:hypothetical protein
MAIRNVPESSVRSYRFVSRFIASPPIIGLVRRGKGSLGYSFRKALSPSIPHENGRLGRGRCGFHIEREHLFREVRT